MESYEDRALQLLVDKARVSMTKDTKLIYMTAYSRYYKVEARDDIPTAATNGLKIFFNPKWAASLSSSKFLFVYLHEIGHIMLFHCARRGKAAVSKWGAKICNLAMDHCVNNMLLKVGLDVPEDAVREDRFIGKTMEYVAEKLNQETDEENQGGNSSDGEGQGDEDQEGNIGEAGSGGSDVEFPEGDDTEANAMRDEIEKKAGEATRLASTMQRNHQLQEEMKDSEERGVSGKSANSINAELEIARSNREPTEWEPEVREFVGADDGFDYRDDWTKMNRRYQGGILSPGRSKITRPKLGIILDTSGSMRDQLPDCLVTIEDINQEGFAIDLVTCDGEVTFQSFGAGELDLSSIVINGGGGSNMAPAFDEIYEKSDCDSIVFISDCCIYWPDKPTIPTLVLHTPCVGDHDFTVDSDFPHSWFKGETDCKLIRKEKVVC